MLPQGENTMKIKLENLTKIFPSRDKKDKTPVVAVKDFDYEVTDGRLVALLGPSGCGKSTVLNMICGLEVPTSGRIFFDNEDVTALPPEKRGVGMVFQSYALYPHLTVRQNIMFPLENLKGKDRLSKEEMEAKAEEAARLVQIEALMNRRPGEMSGGQQQRVSIARALVKRPRVLLLDEPLSNLDARLRLQTREEIRRIQRETGITTIFVTHDQEEAMSISDAIVVMKDGEENQTGRPQEVYDDPKNLFVAKFLGTPPINVFEGQVRQGALYVGNDRILSLAGLSGADGQALALDRAGSVTVGIRPEGFIVDAAGPLRCTLRSIEVMGRDTSIVADHPACQSLTFRAIISSESREGLAEGDVGFSVRPSKVHIFDKEGRRLYFTAAGERG